MLYQLGSCCTGSDHGVPARIMQVLNVPVPQNPWMFYFWKGTEHLSKTMTE